eukprot:gene17100-23396_t
MLASAPAWKELQAQLLSTQNLTEAVIEKRDRPELQAQLLSTQRMTEAVTKERGQPELQAQLLSTQHMTEAELQAQLLSTQHTTEAVTKERGQPHMTEAVTKERDRLVAVVSSLTHHSTELQAQLLAAQSMSGQASVAAEAVAEERDRLRAVVSSLSEHANALQSQLVSVGELAASASDASQLVAVGEMVANALDASQLVAVGELAASPSNASQLVAVGEMAANALDASQLVAVGELADNASVAVSALEEERKQLVSSAGLAQQQSVLLAQQAELAGLRQKEQPNSARALPTGGPAPPDDPFPSMQAAPTGIETTETNTETNAETDTNGNSLSYINDMLLGGQHVNGSYPAAVNTGSAAQGQMPAGSSLLDLDLDGFTFGGNGTGTSGQAISGGNGTGVSGQAIFGGNDTGASGQAIIKLNADLASSRGGGADVDVQLVHSLDSALAESAGQLAELKEVERAASKAFLSGLGGPGGGTGRTEESVELFMVAFAGAMSVWRKLCPRLVSAGEGGAQAVLKQPERPGHAPLVLKELEARLRKSLAESHAPPVLKELEARLRKSLAEVAMELAVRSGALNEMRCDKFLGEAMSTVPALQPPQPPRMSKASQGHVEVASSAPPLFFAPQQGAAPRQRPTSILGVDNILSSLSGFSGFGAGATGGPAASNAQAGSSVAPPHTTVAAGQPGLGAQPHAPVHQPHAPAQHQQGGVLPRGNEQQGQGGGSYEPPSFL